MENKKFLRQKSEEFVKALLKKAQTPEEPAKPDFNTADPEEIKKITQQLKDEYSARKGIKSTKGN